MDNKDLLSKAEILANTLIARCTDDNVETGDYKTLRAELLAIPEIKALVPETIVKYRDLDYFWNFIKMKFPHYSERREYIWEIFEPLVSYLELKSSHPSDASNNFTIKENGIAYIQEEWNKSLDRRETDPEAAITSSRTLIETVCKYILSELNVAFDESEDLPKLYKLTAQNLNLSPELHNEEIFKQILSGCQSIVNGLASLRNKYSDAHGKSPKRIKVTERHSKLAVNLSGTMATFLLETLNFKKQPVK